MSPSCLLHIQNDKNEKKKESEQEQKKSYTAVKKRTKEKK
jgi:hypothetical protein